MKPRLTEKRLRGLGSLAGLAEAGTCEDLGFAAEENLEGDELRAWQSVQAAVRYIRDLQRWYYNR